MSLVGTDVSHGDARRAPFLDQTGVPNPAETYRAAKPVVVASISASF
jgi:hypothetical protein